MESLALTRTQRTRGNGAIAPVDREVIAPFEAKTHIADSRMPAGEGHDALDNRIADLEHVRRYLQKDIAVKDAYLSALRSDLRQKDKELAALRDELLSLHQRIAETLSQPRYRLVDRLNAVLLRFARLHALLKHGILRISSNQGSAADRSRLP